MLVNNISLMTRWEGRKRKYLARGHKYGPSAESFVKNVLEPSIFLSVPTYLTQSIGFSIIAPLMSSGFAYL